MTTTIQAICNDEVSAFRATLMTVFGGNADHNPPGDARVRLLVVRGSTKPKRAIMTKRWSTRTLRRLGRKHDNYATAQANA